MDPIDPCLHRWSTRCQFHNKMKKIIDINLYISILVRESNNSVTDGFPKQRVNNMGGAFMSWSLHVCFTGLQQFACSVPDSVQNNRYLSSLKQCKGGGGGGGGGGYVQLCTYLLATTRLFLSTNFLISGHLFTNVILKASVEKDVSIVHLPLPGEKGIMKMYQTHWNIKIQSSLSCRIPISP